MTPIEGLLHTLDGLLRTSTAVEIAKALAPDSDDSTSSEMPAAGSYGTGATSSQANSPGFAGLRSPTAFSDRLEAEIVRAVLMSLTGSGNPGTPEAHSLMLTAAIRQALAAQPEIAAEQQGFAGEDAAQLLATPPSAARLAMPLHQQVVASGFRTELWDGATSGSNAQPRHGEAADTATTHSTSQPTADSTAAPDQPSRAADKALSPGNFIAAGSSVNEMRGIIASFALNAAMIPGWPYQTQFVAGAPKISEEELLAYLANMGAQGELVEKLRKSRPPAGKRLLLCLAAMLTAVETVVDAIASELALLAGDETALAQDRAAANAHGRTGARHRLYIE
ncbi:hypothetical protein XH83_13270 [Bradyrhizobium sp. CCBAU 53351]|uniref:hypothetical protein n=1 Tax=Bradyrhizobium sp. CCBAU 53351 TaxID=1325114 RepID=UPI00188816AB|nr:hypothetical protein [Bradyrhizobium sp. CCBAU 53351]QOZ76332.1 hypothetical protein XH83_13270 [Bradyrhizobium sp. CCBAU 53351]